MRISQCTNTAADKVGVGAWSKQGCVIFSLINRQELCSLPRCLTEPSQYVWVCGVPGRRLIPPVTASNFAALLEEFLWKSQVNWQVRRVDSLSKRSC